MESLQAAVVQQNCPSGPVPLDARVENLERRLDALLLARCVVRDLTRCSATADVKDCCGSWGWKYMVY